VTLKNIMAQNVFRTFIFPSTVCGGVAIGLNEYFKPLDEGIRILAAFYSGLNVLELATNSHLRFQPRHACLFTFTLTAFAYPYIKKKMIAN
jgi:hypothetical protein